MIKTCVLENGIRVSSFHSSQTERVNIALYFKGGPLYEPAHLNGISHFLEHMFFRKLDYLTKDGLYFQYEKIGAIFRGATYQDFVRFDISVSNIFFKEAFNLIQLILNDFTWNEADVEKEKQIVLKQIELSAAPSFSKYVDTYYLANKRYCNPIMGVESTVRTFHADILNKWKRNIFSPSNCYCCITGNFSDGHYLYALESLSSKQSENHFVNHQNPIIAVKDFCKKSKSTDKIVGTNYDTSDISLIFDADKAIHSEYTLTLLSCILCGGGGSRLTSVLREQYALTDEMEGFAGFFPDFSRFVLEFSTDNADILQALQLVFEQISLLKKNIVQKDINTTIHFYTTNLFWGLEDPRELNFWIAWRDFILQRDVDFKKIIDSYNQVTIDNLLLCANNVFRPENLTITVTSNSKICKRKDLKEKMNACRNSL